MGWLKAMRRSRKGAIGIETLIVFIALVLVAAVSAAVLIQTVGYLQQKATATGRETTKEVASGLKIDRILGYDPDAPGGNVTRLAIFLETNTGGQAVDLSKTIVTLNVGNKTATLHYNSNAVSDLTEGSSNIFNSTLGAWANLTSSSYGLIVLLDSDGSLIKNKATPTLNSGDKVVLTIDVSKVFYNSTAGAGFPTNTVVSGEVRPELGAPGIIQFTTPPAYTVSIMELQ